jgi:integrase
MSRQLGTVTHKALTAASDALEVGDYLLFEAAPGLRLVAGKSARTWIHRYRVGERIAQVRIGAFPAFSLAEAITTVEENNRRRERGDDPATARDKAREQRVRDESAQRARAYTVGRMVEDYLAEHVEPTRTPKSATEVRRVLVKDAVPKFGTRAATDVSRSDAVQFLATLALRTPAGARVTRMEMRAAFDHALSHGRIDEGTVNPWEAAGRDRSLRSKLKANRRTRYLTDGECAALLHWLPQSKMSRTVRDALNLTLMLGMRSGEVVAGEWSDLDLDVGTWSLPKTKTDAPRTVRLPRQAVDVLKARRALHPAFVFPTQARRGEVAAKPIRQNALGWAVDRYKDRLGLADWSAHDLRRSCRTGLSRIGCPTEVAEAALGHSKPGIVGNYDLHAYEAEVGEWLQRWADHLEALTSPSVVPLKVRA